MLIYIVTHKKIPLKNSKIRKKIKVGSKIDDIEYLNDSDGDNISSKNPFYCELTALYWIWKNSNENIVGLEHYRRFFASSITPFKYKFLTEKEINKYLKKFDLIIPQFGTFGEFKKFSNISEAYKIIGERDNTHIYSDLEYLDKVIKEHFANEYDQFSTFFYKMNVQTSYNMFITNKHIISEYCQWLFSVFDFLEKEIKGYDDRVGNTRRLFGYLSELLFGYWIWKNKILYKQVPLILTEEFKELSIMKRCKLSIKFNIKKIMFYFEDKKRFKKFIKGC